MYINQSSLIQKVMKKGIVLTPFEAIHLKYLSRKGILNDLINIEKAENPYLVADRVKGPISPFIVKFMTRKAAEESPEQFYSYNFAYEEILRQDSNSEKQGYRGLMLITQLRLTKAEFRLNFDKDNPRDILEYESYSYYDQAPASFVQTAYTLGETFRYFIQDIDIILTLNYYLHQLVDLRDLSCLKILKSWLSVPPQGEEEFKHLNGAYLACTKESVGIILKKNHPNYIESLAVYIQDLPHDFVESSQKYVEDVLSQIIPKNS